MLLHYNFQNSKIGKAKINLIYSNNQTSKVTIINGTRLKIRYPYNIKNNLTSNVLVIQNLKFKSSEESEVPNTNRVEGISNGNTSHLKPKKNHILTRPNDKNKEKNYTQDRNYIKNDNKNINISENKNNKNKIISNFSADESKDGTLNKNYPSNYDLNKNLNNLNTNKMQSQRLNLKIKRKISPEGNDNFPDNLNNGLQYHYKNLDNNFFIDTNKNIDNIISPIVNLPGTVSKTKVLPSIINKNSTNSAMKIDNKKIDFSKFNNDKNSINNSISLYGESKIDNLIISSNKGLNENNVSQQISFPIRNNLNDIHIDENTKRIELNSPEKNGINFLKRLRHSNDKHQNNKIKYGVYSLRNKNNYLNKDLKEFNEVNLNNDNINYNLTSNQEELEKDFNSIIHTNENKCLNDNKMIVIPFQINKNSNERFSTLPNTSNNRYYLVNRFFIFIKSLYLKNLFLMKNCIIN